MQSRRAVYGRWEATGSKGKLGGRSGPGLTVSLQQASLQSVSRVMSSSWSRALVEEAGTSSSKQPHAVSLLKNSTLQEGAGAVLDREGVKMLPGSAVVVEGQSLQLTCVAAQLLRQRQDDVPYMAFQFPPMPETFKNRVTITLRPGIAVLKFRHVVVEHGGRYRCVLTSETGQQTYNTVTLKVLRRALNETSLSDLNGDSREDWVEKRHEMEDKPGIGLCIDCVCWRIALMHWI